MEREILRLKKTNLTFGETEWFMFEILDWLWFQAWEYVEKLHPHGALSKEVDSVEVRLYTVLRCLFQGGLSNEHPWKMAANQKNSGLHSLHQRLHL